MRRRRGAGGTGRFQTLAPGALLPAALVSLSAALVGFGVAFAVFGAVLVAASPGAVARAAPQPSAPALGGFAAQRAAFFADRLRSDSVYVTDNAPDRVPPGTADQIKTIVAPLHTPVYVVVTLTGLSRTDADTAETLAPLIRDRLGRDGVYIVTNPSGGGTAVQYGGSLPIEHAWEATDSELPYDQRSLLTYLRHFVTLVMSGQVEQHYRNPQRPPEPKVKAETDAWDRHDREEDIAVNSGTAVGGSAVLALLFWWSRRRRTRSSRSPETGLSTAPRRSAGRATNTRKTGKRPR